MGDFLGRDGGADYPETVSLYAPSIAMDRRVLLAGALASGAMALGSCSGRLEIDAAPGSAARLAAAAQMQLGVTTGYDPDYTKLAYPGGDVPRKVGVCCDVIIRAARDGLGLDLQQLVHEDMVKDFDAYPSRARWGLSGPDPNIDHRRVPNLETFFARAGARLWRASGKAGTMAFPGPLNVGDILTWRSRGDRSHIGIVSRGGEKPLIIHNIGWGVMQHRPGLMVWQHAAGHYRWPVIR
jgi:uncharacterized protein YijF (DUF1287 family)